MFNIFRHSRASFSTLSRMVKIRPPVVLDPVTLEGRYIKLEPMTRDHFPALCEVGLDSTLWKWTITDCSTPELMKSYVETAVSWKEAGTALPFVTIEKSSGRVIGSTRFAMFDGANRRVEIGWTWLTPSKQRTPYNTEAKLLMLTHAFEKVDLLRVEFRTDVLNDKSRNAMERIGLKQEGIFRSNMIMGGGRVRDTVYYSIIDTEWPEFKKGLETRLSKPYTQA